MLEVLFRFRHDCETSRISRRHPEAVIAQWCNFRTEILEVHAREAGTVDAIQGDLVRLGRRPPKTVRRSSPGPSTHIFSILCRHKRDRAIDALIEKEGCLYLPPILYQEGWETYRVLAFEDASLASLMRALARIGDVELVRKRASARSPVRESFTLRTDDLLAELTAKQAAALSLAVQHGYYDIPKRVQSAELARRSRVPRTTFEEHVRKAESKVIRAMAPYLSLYAKDGR